jgi:FtsX-like permease family
VSSGGGTRAFGGAEVRLRPGSSAAAFRQRAQALARKFPSTGGQVYLADEDGQSATVERSIRPQAVALGLFALVLALTALLIIGQAAARVLAATALNNPGLSALGMTRLQLAAVALVQVSVAAAAGAVLAGGLAIALSPLMPIGPARLAEPAPGISADGAVLAAGIPAIVLLVIARAAWPAWRLAAGRAAARDGAQPGRSRTVQWLSGIGAPVTITTGVRLALEPGHGRTAVPVRSALAGTMLSVLAVVAAFTFGTSLTHLVRVPGLYGQNWDAAIDLQFQGLTPGQARHLLGRDPGIAGWSFGNHGILTIGHLIVPAIGITPGHGPLLSPTILQGRPPAASDEIVLGSSTLRQIGRQVGQEVTVDAGGHSQRDLIVGRAVFPNFGQGSFTPTDLGRGAETTAAVLQPQVRAVGGGSGYQFMLLHFTPGPRRAANLARFRRSLSGFCATIEQSTCVVTDQHPNGVVNYARIDGTPEVLAAVLAALGLAVLSQMIVMSGRRRRTDFAVLKSLGMLRRQVSSITAWQVSTLVALALAAGLPLGVAAGRRAWVLFAAALGVPADARTPATFLLVLVPAAVLIVNLVAWLPARRASGVRPSDALRSE